MQTYFLHAKNVGELTRILLAKMESLHVKKNPSLVSKLKNVITESNLKLDKGFFMSSMFTYVVVLVFPEKSRGDGAPHQEPAHRPGPEGGEAALRADDQDPAARRRRVRQVHLPQADEDHTRRRVRGELH